METMRIRLWLMAASALLALGAAQAARAQGEARAGRCGP
jgi:hypothetical protein